MVSRPRPIHVGTSVTIDSASAKSSCQHEKVTIVSFSEGKKVWTRSQVVGKRLVGCCQGVEPSIRFYCPTTRVSICAQSDSVYVRKCCKRPYILVLSPLEKRYMYIHNSWSGCTCKYASSFLDSYNGNTTHKMGYLVVGNLSGRNPFG